MRIYNFMRKKYRLILTKSHAVETNTLPFNRTVKHNTKGLLFGAFLVALSEKPMLLSSALL